MRGGVRVWKRGLNGHGLRHATAYALQGGCDAARVAAQVSAGADVGAAYADVNARVTRWAVTGDGLVEDKLDADRLRTWIDGRDPQSGQQRGRAGVSPSTHLFYDATVNAPKTYSLAAVLHPELREAFNALNERVTGETLTAWQKQLSTRRGKGGSQRIGIARIEAVQLDHERSRSLDPHAHRHLWLNAKVLGDDGKWSNVDSQQMFRHQSLVNARGELAARTDQQWREALASFGFSLNADGEIAELAHLVEPMSKRARQIEANKARYEAEWRRQNPGSEPSPRLVAMWDARAWAEGREQKPGDINEQEWQETVRREIGALDPAVLVDRTPQPAVGVARTLDGLDRQELAAFALGWADQRSTRSGGRFSRIDLRAGALMAIAQLQIVAHPADLQAVAREVETLGLADVESLASVGLDAPEDVKTLRLTAVGETRADIVARVATRAAVGETTRAAEHELEAVIAGLAEEREAAGESAIQIDERQRHAAAIVAGNSPVAVIEGPAGAGKTTMLTVAQRVIDGAGGKLVTVAPTMKAALVASAEIGTAGSSLHGLLYKYGYRWSTTDSGATKWHRLNDGDVDKDGTVYQSPGAELSAADVIVCDEAGMVDLDAMAALFTVADETGTRVVLVGDPHQVRPVGHSGAMSLVASQTPAEAVTILESVHRFRDKNDPRKTDLAYAKISRDLRGMTNKTGEQKQGTRQEREGMRDAEKALAGELSAWLVKHGHVQTCETSEAQIAAAADLWLEAHSDRETIAITADSNEVVGAVNDAIQQRRLAAGALSTATMTMGRGGVALYEGDVVSTRKNQRGANFSVANRETWTIKRITDDQVIVSGGIDGREETLSLNYVRDHLDLSYATTIHGAQGTTTRHAATLVTDETTSSDFYVGMTRGQLNNQALIVSEPGKAEIAALTNTILRAREDVTDAQLRDTVNAEVKRAGETKDHTPATEYLAWNDATLRPFGDLVRPDLTYVRCTLNRDVAARKVAELENKIGLAKAAIDTEHAPAYNVAQRDGVPAQELQTLETRLERAKLTHERLVEKLKPAKAALNKAESNVAQLATEIQYRAGLSPETAANEARGRAHAAPAKPTDKLSRPFGLSQDLDTDRAARNTVIKRAQAQQTRGADTLEKAEREFGAHTNTLADLNDELRAETEKLHTIIEAHQSQTMTALRAHVERVKSLRTWGIGAKKKIATSRGEFQATWGQPLPDDVSEGWLTKVSQAHVSEIGDVNNAEASVATTETQIAKVNAQLAKTQRLLEATKTSINRAEQDITRANLDLNELTVETTVRGSLNPDDLTKENQQRWAIAEKQRAAIPAPAQARTAVASARAITSDSLER